MDTAISRISTIVRNYADTSDVDRTTEHALENAMHTMNPAFAALVPAEHERKIPWIPDNGRTRVLRAGMRALCALAPSLAVRVVDRVWFTPPRAPIRAETAAFLRSGAPLSFRVHDRHVAGWSWGQGPAVLLMHGWGGHAGQMQAFVEPLVAAGFRAVAFDAPSHGASGPSRLRGRLVSFLEFPAALREVSAAMGPVAGLIAHSSGCTASALAIRDGWQGPTRVVFVAPFVFPDAYADPFAKALGVSTQVMAAFRAQVEQRFGRPWSDFDISGLPRVTDVPALLLIHDHADAEVPFGDSHALAAAWPQARLIDTTGLGHRKLLRDAEVIGHAVAFVVEADTAATLSAGRQSPADARDELDRYFEAARFQRC